ncbi:MAG: GNAT family N-acyltransferase [Gammaproteobacteria bacterium]
MVLATLEATHPGEAARRREESPKEIGLVAGLAFDPEEVLESQRLRYDIFAREMGAKIDSGVAGVDADEFDDCCHHLVVRDRRTGQLVASTRVLTDEQAARAGGYYSEKEFDLGRILSAPGRTMEIGRTCVHRDYRNGATISMLWSGLARFLDINRFSRMIGCASIPMTDGGVGAWATYRALGRNYLSAPDMRAIPRLPLAAGVAEHATPLLPPLLKAYMRLGARICGEPCADPEFNVADLLIMLNPAELRGRYVKRYLSQR